MITINPWVVILLIVIASFTWLAIMSLISSHITEAKSKAAYYDELTRKEKLER